MALAPSPEAIKRTPDAHRGAEIAAATGSAAKKRAAAPEWSDLVGAFGEKGAVRNKRGKVVGYKYPHTGDAVKDALTARKAYELWEPHRRVSVDSGGEASARLESRMVKVRTRNKGTVKVLPESAAAVVQEYGAAPRLGYSRAYSEAPYWKEQERREAARGGTR